jgi:hypothetical protein
VAERTDGPGAWFSAMSVREGLGVMLVPAVLTLITVVAWMTVVVTDRLWARVQLLPVRVHNRR